MSWPCGASNWPSRYLSVAGNFNLTNTHELFEMLVGLGQHPIGSADTSTVRRWAPPVGSGRHPG